MSAFSEHVLEADSQLINLVELLVPQIKKAWDVPTSPISLWNATVYSKVVNVTKYDYDDSSLTYLAQCSNVTLCQETPNSFFCENVYAADGSVIGDTVCGYEPRKLYVNLFSGNPTDNNVEIKLILQMTFSTIPQQINDYYEPRLIDIPSVELAIDGRFEATSRRGGGSIMLNNRDGLFSKFPFSEIDFNNAKLTVKIGVNTTEYVMPIGDYITLGSWSVESHDKDNNALELRTADLKNDLDVTYGLSTISTVDGKYEQVPAIYGKCYACKCFQVSSVFGSYAWKVSSLPISSITSAWLEIKDYRDIVSSAAQYVQGQFLFDADKVYVRGIITSLTKATATFSAQFVATIEYFAYGQFKQAVDPVTGTNLPHTYSISMKYNVLALGVLCWVNEWHSFTADTAIPTVTQHYWYDSANQILYANLVAHSLVDDYNRLYLTVDLAEVGNDPIVDVVGKEYNDGYPMETASRIISDVIDRCESNLYIDPTSLDTVRGIERTGIDIDGNIRWRMPLSVYIDTETTASEIISRICATENVTLAPLSVGMSRLIPHSSQPAGSLPFFDDTEIFSFSKITDGSRYPQVSANANETYSAYYPDFTTLLTTPNFIRNVNPSAKIDQRESHLIDSGLPANNLFDCYVTQSEVLDYYLQTKLTQYAQLPVRYSCQLSSRIVESNLGDFIYLESDRFGVQIVGQILEMRLSASSKVVDVVLGDIYGVKHRAAFLANSPTEMLPIRYLEEAGYGIGSADWNADWSMKIKRYARYAFGYQHDLATGMIDASDEMSANTCGVM